MAKVIIELPNNMQDMCRWHKDGICALTGVEVDMIAEAIAKGMTFPDNATNGNMIQNICSTWIEYHDTDVEVTIHKKIWNAPYRIGGIDGGRNESERQRAKI